ncbi:acyltransferase family protein [Halocatena pleomorpha]|uniref:Acyltransferase n=1 Tax=Halocatena pleomorpha TaxID=1785090 RepID=A0A3P3RLA0_9EURY|nr:acyltransferase [Halocatena pleomorpha]RRJ33668.1 acyltransferase [Halocatena pleomorpha]
MTSGYFFATNISNTNISEYFFQRARRITSIYVFGILLTAPVFLVGTVVSTHIQHGNLMSNATHEIIGFMSPLELLYYGDSISEILWFLPALLYSLALISLFVTVDKTKYLIPVSLGFHVVGLLGASYTMFVDIPFPNRDALFFGFFYTSLGYYISAHDWQPATERSKLYLGATVLFGVLHIAERYVLGYIMAERTFAHSVYAPSYTIVTVLLTVSLFLFLLSRPALGKSTPLPSLGKYAVGVYVVHPSVLFVLQNGSAVLGLLGYGIENTIVWHLILTPATFIGSLLIYAAADELGLVEIGGSHLPRLDQLRVW